jgi:hypothetical protein
MKLFLIRLKGPIGKHNNCYVLADDPTEAYDKVRKFLDNYDIGTPDARALYSIEVIADMDTYQDSYPMMHL